ncbi:MAG: hypothetical protein GTO12_23250 [Proteobacteria bacterium]|nr:hypothetical protein [Pseudomonadota bacterium]
MKNKLVPIALLGIFLVGCHEPPRKEFSSSEGGFSIVMPGTPSEKTQTVNIPLGRIDVHFFSVNKGDEGVYTVAYSDYPKSYVQMIPAEALLDAARDGSVAGLGGKLLGEEIISLNEYPGRRINAELAGGTGRQKACIFLVGRRLYQVLWTGPKEKADLKSVGEFLDSFKLLEMPKPRISPGADKIHEAVRDGDIDKIKTLADENPEMVNAKDNNGWTPLHHAAALGHGEVIEFLLAKGTETNAKDKDGRTPLHYAAREGYGEVVKLLLAKGAEINAKTKYGWTPLHWAASTGHKEVVEFLLAKGAEINAKTKDGRTPLHHAAFDDEEEVVKLLLTKGAEINAKDKDGRTPLAVAVWADRENVVELLRQHGGVK